MPTIRAPLARAAGAFAPVTAMLLACAAPPAAGGPALPRPETRQPGGDTVTIAMLAGELGSFPDTGGFRSLGGRPVHGGPVAYLVELAPADTVAAPYIRFATIAAGADPRDLLDSTAAGPAGPADVLVTRDPSVIGYAKARAGFVVEPLPWDRVYAAVLTDPSRTRIAPTAELRASLAHGAVRADARGARPAYAWEHAGCTGTGARSSSPARRIIYRDGDPVARDLAERLVAMDGTVTAAPLAGDRLAAALATGADAAYVVRLPLALDTAAACAPLPSRPAGAAIVPLVETRPHAIVRAGTPPLLIGSGVPLRYAPDSTR